MLARGFPVVKHLPAKGEKAGGMRSIPGSGRFPGVRNSNPLQYACPENSMGRGAWKSTVRRVAKSWTSLRD